ncbi:MAG: HAMP domain-containing histidine kinase [Chromatiales bacterium]|jgi:signal transduction histidine kinase|nr:HAMP domain-containing histidine kinase [Chromatiales bacterium]
MHYRDSLRLRIVFSFVIAGAILGPLLTMLLLWTTYTLEERAVTEAAIARLKEVIATPHQFALRPLHDLYDIQVLTNLNASDLPREIADLPDGLQEYESDGDTWIVAMATLPQAQRYAVVEDITALEQRERVGAVVIAAGTLLAIYIALWLGFYLSRHLVAPLTQLSERVDAAGPAGSETALASYMANDEIGRLAAALDSYALRMREALRREQEFSADASHELRNPLAVIQSAAELIEDDASTSERSRRAARRMHAAALRMNETVMVLLMLAREDLAQPSDGAEVSVADCVETLLQDELLLQDGADDPRIEWRYEARPLLAAPNAIIEVIASNLIRNARQHSRANVIDVLLTADRLLVTDDGIGVPAEQIPQLLERGARGATAGGVGYGLGLSLVQRLCERFGWSLHVDSDESTRVEWRFG